MSKHSVLLIDDEDAIRLALRKWFERRGWLVHEAGDGDTAILRLEAEHGTLSLVICDLHMPGKDGEEIAQVVAERWRPLLDRFVFSTGDVVEHAPEGSILRHHALVLPKPFEFAHLRALVTDVVGADSLS